MVFVVGHFDLQVMIDNYTRRQGVPRVDGTFLLKGRWPAGDRENGQHQNPEEILKEPERSGAKIERKGLMDNDPRQAPVVPKTAEQRTAMSILLPIRSQIGGAMHGR
ncbi:hypothetical protein [Mesorhizobium sp. 128a]